MRREGERVTQKVSVMSNTGIQELVSNSAHREGKRAKERNDGMMF